MAGLTRYLQKLFGISAGSNQMAKYGSFLTTPALYDGATITPDIIQALVNFNEGLYSAVGGAYSPTIQDQNSLFFLAFYQLSYLLTRGIPEWDAGTTYNTNDFCKIGNILYYSLTDSNTNNDPTSDIVNWKNDSAIAPTRQIFTSGSGTYTLPTSPRKPLWLSVEVCAAGGGGQGSGDGSLGGNGTDGGNSSFGTSYLTANGGKGGGPYPGAGGSSGSSSILTLLFTGQNGGSGVEFEVTSVAGSGNLFTFAGGAGGNSLFNGGATGNSSGSLVGASALPNTGGGGAGAGIAMDFRGVSGIAFTGSAGGGGGYLKEIIYNPLNTYSYSIGNKGTGGSGTGGAYAGGAGADGIIIITEYYQ